MNKKEIIDFFNCCAPKWDADMIRDDDIIDTILRNGGIKPGVDVLDVACGTGVLFPDYLKLSVKTITGVDISPEMVNVALRKKWNDNVKVICGDIEAIHLEKTYDCCMVYNAFPHFPDPVNLIRVLAEKVKPGGTLSIAHGMSRERVNCHHKGCASRVSRGLETKEELAKLFSPYFNVNLTISNEHMYQVCGVKR